MTQTMNFTPQRAVIAEFSNYESAEAAVDLLADKDFEVGTARIVGHDLKSVEQIIGKRTYGRSALWGAMGGAWFGLLMGLLFGLFLPSVVWATAMLGSVLLAALFGLVFGLLSHAISGRDRSFTATKGLKAGTYTVEVLAERADEAHRILQAGR